MYSASVSLVINSQHLTVLQCNLPPLCACIQLGSVPALVGADRALTGLRYDDISLVPIDTEDGSRSTAHYIVWCTVLGLLLEIVLSLVQVLKYLEIINTKSKLIIPIVSPLHIFSEYRYMYCACTVHVDN